MILRKDVSKTEGQSLRFWRNKKILSHLGNSLMLFYKPNSFFILGSQAPKRSSVNSDWLSSSKAIP